MANLHCHVAMAKSHPRTGELIQLTQLTRPSDLSMRRLVQLELPEFLIRALERRVAEANEDAPIAEHATLNDYVESELVNIITLRDVAELEIEIPGFGAAVQLWLQELRE